MSDEEYAKVQSQLDGENSEEEKAIQEAVKKKAVNKGPMGLAGKAATAGTKIVSGGLAAVQSASASGVAIILSVALGLAGLGNDSFLINYRDDVTPENPYECLDEYVDAYTGVFGTLDEQPLPQNDNNVLQKLKQINEWSKTYVAQSVPDKLVCTEEDCPYYGHEGCTDPDHGVQQFSTGEYTYYNSDARIDLANVMRIRDFFRAYGLTDVQIAAMCGVMTMESRIDFTSIEGYNLQGDRYNLEPSQSSAEYAWKPWAEGITGHIGTATCIHEIATTPYTGAHDTSIDYQAYSSKYPNIYKLGLGLVGFTDGPGFHNNTFIRNYADTLNDRVDLIQSIIEGSRGWRDELRQRAADKYTDAYGASGNTMRGYPQSYIMGVEGFGFTDETMSSGHRYAAAIDQYIYWGEKLEAAWLEYVELANEYKANDDKLHGEWLYHTVTSETKTGVYDSTVYKSEFTLYGVDEFFFHITDYNEHDTYYFDWRIPTPGDHWVKNPNPPYPYGNNKTNWLEATSSIIMPSKYGLPLGTIKDEEHHYIEYPDNPKERAQNYIDGQYPWSYANWSDSALTTLQDYEKSGTCCSCSSHLHYYTSNGHTYSYVHTEAKSECGKIQDLINRQEALAPRIDELRELIKEELLRNFLGARDEFNAASWAHIKNQVEFYNAERDYYTACEFDMEARLRDATIDKESIFNDKRFYTEAVFEYKFNKIINNERVKFRDLFNLIEGKGENSEDKLTPQELRLYYELWQNYAKYATNLPKSGKYINWWTPETQLLFLVGGSYDAEKGRGIKLKEEYKNATCPICRGELMNVERDTVGQYYYDWMSTWKGDDYTGRDLTTATKNFFYDMISGGFDDGSLQERTEYAYAYYYMFQYDTPYQQAINYAAVGGEASKIMDEMIAEARWQVNTANTLSDTAMPKNDKWKPYQTAEITRQWEIDTATSLSKSVLSTLGEKQSKSRVNLLENIWNGCRYVNVIDNSTIGNAAIYLVDNPLIYASASNEFRVMKYGENADSEKLKVSSLYHVVFDTINRRLSEKGKATMGSDPSDGFAFVKTAVLWSGLDEKFEDISNVEELEEYLKESTSSIWQTSEQYQEDKEIGTGNTKIWEQRKLGPYYTSDGAVYYRYRWTLVPRVLDPPSGASTDEDWYNNIRDTDEEIDGSFGDIQEDNDKFNEGHGVATHDKNNAPITSKGFDTNGYKRFEYSDGYMADWVRVDWECWDPDCGVCGGRGGHGDYDSLAPGDIIIKDGQVFIWLGESTVQAMFPLEMENATSQTTALTMAGGSDSTRLKSAAGASFSWSKPCASYINHETPCPAHDTEAAWPMSPSRRDPNSCKPYNPDGKWTAYRLIVPNYTDEYRSAGVIYDMNEDWETWYKYRYKGMEPSSDTRTYLDQVRKELGLDINTNYPRDKKLY